MNLTGRVSAVIQEHEVLCDNIYSMWVQTELSSHAKPGQFFQVFVPDRSKLLGRPISICEIDQDRKSVRFVYRTNGPKSGTQCISRLQTGDHIEIMGPYGNGFPIEESSDKHVLVIGGGIGIPPLVEVAKQCKSVSAVVGYAQDTFLTKELSLYADLHITTEDGSHGIKGNVMAVLDHISQYITVDAQRFLDSNALVFFACGPSPMLRAVAELAESQDIPCYVSVEERMACGIGACLACVCETKELDSYSQVHNRRVCKEGPVFLSTEVML